MYNHYFSITPAKLQGGEISFDNLEEDEKIYGLTAEWLELSKLDAIKVGSTVDWRPIVKQVLEARRYAP